jgi:hypothetical protein
MFSDATIWRYGQLIAEECARPGALSDAYGESCQSASNWGSSTLLVQAGLYLRDESSTQDDSATCMVGQPIGITDR